ncbi:MAG: bifunctional (p)ppGpp synthetase/guanosine-3',5'-bis(diphosphate) 3'-pyrophosphohydrolase, partial [Dehalococcoidia bacterium]
MLEKVREYLPPEKVDLIQRAYDYAAELHAGQTRKSGEAYIEHPVSAAKYLADLSLDGPTIAAALLHDVIEDCGVNVEDLRARFGEDVARLVDGVTKLTKLDLVSNEASAPLLHFSDDGQAESIRKMLVAMAEDIRVVLIKLADRLHNMRTLGALSPERRVAIAQETLDIYAPLAHRLGMGEIKWQLEDMAFRHLQPNQYRAISKLLASKRQEREAYIQQVTDVLKRELARANYTSEVTGRPKHIYSIYRKSQSYAAQGKQLGDIYDLFAVRVLVPTVQDCYGVLGVVHSLWRPVPGQFDDYIANPKENMYQSLHTSVRCIGGLPVEVQVRTYQMHQISEYGVASHWRYKEGASHSHSDERFEERMTWLRQLLEWQRDLTGAEEFLESVKMDIFKDQVFVYTPKSDIKELPAGSTSIDFAYRIHTALGHRCIGAKVNGKLVALDTQLKNGDTVEILTSKVARGPSLDWLNPHLGFVRTANARQAIRSWFRREERGANIQRGRDLFKRELKRLNADVDEKEVAQIFNYDDVEDFLAAMGSGVVSMAQVAGRLSAKLEAPQTTHGQGNGGTP